MDQPGPGEGVKRLVELRLSQGAAAVLPFGLAVRLLPFKNKAAVRWLRNTGLVETIWVEDDGATRAVEVVIWGRVLEAIETGSVPAEHWEREEDPGDRLDLGPVSKAQRGKR